MVKKYILACCRFPISECIKGYFIDQMEDDIYSSTKDAVNVLTPAENDLEQAIIDLGSVEAVVGSWPCAKLRDAVEDVARRYINDDDTDTVYWIDPEKSRYKYVVSIEWDIHLESVYVGASDAPVTAEEWCRENNDRVREYLENDKSVREYLEQGDEHITIKLSLYESNADIWRDDPITESEYAHH